MEKARCDFWYGATLWPKVIFGIVAAGAFIWDLYTDSHHYMGNDFNKAATVSTIAFAVGISVGLLATGIGAPVGVTLLAGIASGTIIGSVEDPIKKQWIGY